MLVLVLVRRRYQARWVFHDLTSCFVPYDEEIAASPDVTALHGPATGVRAFSATPALRDRLWKLGWGVCSRV